MMDSISRVVLGLLIFRAIGLSATTSTAAVPTVAEEATKWAVKGASFPLTNTRDLHTACVRLWLASLVIKTFAS